jgi:hypothetical protein
MLLQKIRGPKNSRAVEELHEYDHIVPFFGLGREVLNSVSFFLGSTAARGCVILGKNATGGSARSDSILHARLTHEIKVVVQTKSDVTDSVLLQDVMNFMRGDVVSARLLSLTGSIVFNDMLARIMNRSKHLPHLVGQSTSVVCQALQNSYEVTAWQLRLLCNYLIFRACLMLIWMIKQSSSSTQQLFY